MAVPESRSAVPQTVQFGLDGAYYEADLNAPEAELLRGLLAPYIAAGYRLTRPNRKSREVRRFVREELPPDPATVRAWAQARGYQLPRRGRIPEHVMSEFRRALG